MPEGKSTRELLNELRRRGCCVSGGWLTGAMWRGSLAPAHWEDRLIWPPAEVEKAYQLAVRLGRGPGGPGPKRGRPKGGKRAAVTAARPGAEQ